MTKWVKRTEEEVKEIVENFGYVYINNYYEENTAFRRVVFQDKVGYKYDIRLGNLMIKDRGTRFVDKSNPFTLSHNIPLWIKVNKLNIELLENNMYVNSHRGLNFYCHNCEDYFSISWNNLSQGKRCGVCDGKQVGIYHNIKYQFPDIAKEWHPTKNGESKPEDFSYGSNKKVWWLCPNGHEYLCLLSHRTLRSDGCPVCSISKGEKTIYDYLVKNNISFERGYPLPNCKYKKQLRVDFYIPDSNTVIEYDGKHHFIPVDFAGRGEKWAKQEFKEVNKKDFIKTKYCKNNNIKLLRISYLDFNDIEQILTENLP